MPGPLYTRLFEIAAGQYGYLTANDAHELGVPVTRLNTMAARGALVHVSRGVYRFPIFPSGPLDQYFEMTLWPRGGGVISHATALDLHGLCDVNPAKIDVTVKLAHRITREPPPVMRLHRRTLDDDDVTWHEGIPIVTPKRAILDGIEQHLGSELIDQAIDTAKTRGVLRRRDLAEINDARRDALAA